MRFFVRNLAGNYLVYGLSIFAGLVLTPIVIHAIGKEAFGIWAVIGSITVFLRVLDFGLAPTLVRYSAYYRARGEQAELARLASCGLLLYVALAGLITLAGLVLAWLLPSFVSIHGAGLTSSARIAAAVTVLALAIELPVGIFSSLLKGAQRFDFVNAGAILSLAVYAVLVIAVLRHDASVGMLAAISLAATVVRVLVPAFLVRRELPELRLSTRLVSLDRLRTLTAFSGFASISQIAAKIVFSSDAIVIGVILGAPAAAFYAVASRLFNVAQGIASTGTDLLFPAVSGFEGRGEKERQQLYLVAGLRASTCVVVLVTAPLIVLPGWVLRGWLGHGFAASRAVLVLLALTLYFTQPTMLMAQYLLGRGRPRSLATVQLLFGLGNLALTIGLLLGFRHLWLAPLATLALESIVAAVILPAILVRDGVRYSDLATGWARSVAAGVVPAAVTLVPAAFIWRGSSSLLGVLAVGVLWAAALLPAAWWIGFGDEERSRFRQAWREVAARHAHELGPTESRA